MVANQVTLESFLSKNKTQFVIPVYQRNYDWTSTQCQQLFDDIIEVSNKEEESHFIGSIVFIHDGVYTTSEVKPLVVIDGQQRLTTITLLYLALYQFAKNNGKKGKAAEINETYLINKFVADDDSKLKLKQTDNNTKAFKYLMGDNPPEEYPEYSRVIENYTFFKKRIEADNFQNILNGLKRLLFVEISLERGKDDPQRIFESLNSTGLELSQADLIRNYILMGLPPKKQIKIYNNIWYHIELFAQDETKKKSMVSEFIRHYLTIKNKKIPNINKVYLEFKNRFQNRDNDFYNNTLTEIKEYSRFYHRMINPEKEKDKDIRKELNFIRRIEINVAFPFLISVYNDYIKEVIDKKTFLKVLKLVQSFTWRRFILGLPSNSLNKIFMTLYSEVDVEDYLPSIEKVLVQKRGTQRFPNNKEIKTALKEKDMYNTQSKNKLYFLELLENHNNREFVSIDNPDITIEHIFPRNPSPKWKETMDEKDYTLFSDVYLHTIGNLTLSGNNGSLSNKTFTEKKEMNVDDKEQGYKFSRLWLNSYLQEIDKWGKIELHNRFDKILKRFYEVWYYPEIDELFKDEAEEVNIFEADDPKNKRLQYFVFKDERVLTNEVSKMYYHVLENLFEENPQAFLSSELKEFLPLRMDKAAMRMPVKIGDNYYIESNLDSNSKFRRIKKVLNVFGLEDELTLKYQ